jgi:G patch domain-containing protein 1
MANRPVYVPSRKRTKKQFFHGAFTGGFSAGFNNTVGSKEGWAPRVEETERLQMPEDFMDEQDHDEWGGPTSVQQEYEASTSATKTHSSDPMLDLVKPPAQNVGHRLLRVLGWRNGSVAYVPEEDALLPTSSQEQSIQAMLSSKQLKKIQLQQKRVALPVPKLDTCGLGYDQYHNAPEFRAHRERRRKQAQERAKAVTASSAENRNVYRLSNLLGDKEPEKVQNEEIEEDNPLLSYETEQSFVGTKTVGGFALREDDDDVYDDGPKTCAINRDEYDTVVYEHTSDVEDDATEDKNEQEFSAVLASWATSKAGASDARTNRGITSDGRLPLSGFVLGASNMTTGQPTRYPGPDIPDGYEPKRHEFGEGEYPGTWQDESRNIQQEIMEQRRKSIQAERTKEISHKQKERESGPMASAAFAELAFAMKNRFTTSAPDEARDAKPSAIGLQQPTAECPIIIDRLHEQSVPSQAASKPITIQRSVMTFSPESLLCKRFHVVAPHHAKLTTGTKALESKGEAAYFESEILSRVTSSSASASNERISDKKHALQEKLPEEEGADEGFLDNRPSMKVLESIFEPDSESSESEQETKANEPTAAGLNDQITRVPTHTPAPTPSGIPYNELAPPHSPTEEGGLDQKEGRCVVEQEGEKKRKSRKQSRRISRDEDDRKRRRRSSQSCSSSDRSGRRRKEKKKKKKRHKSSKHSKD